MIQYSVMEFLTLIMVDFGGFGGFDDVVAVDAFDDVVAVDASDAVSRYTTAWIYNSIATHQ